MTPNPSITDIQHGWKVFAQSDEVGSVIDVARDHLLVEHGLIRRHLYRVPREDIREASSGIVDLRLDREQFEELEVDLDAERGEALPDEYVRLEGDGSVTERKPPDPQTFIR